MSLHLANLSSRVRKDDLERVFRRFGCCSIQLQSRDNSGFIFYDYPVNAERALKTLQGKKICGEPLTLSWSNRQSNSRQVPRFRNEFENVSEFDHYEPYYKRDGDEINRVEQVHQRKGVVQIVTKKTQRGCCYNCGELGHKMRNCPQKREPKRKLNGFDHKRNDKFRRIESVIIKSRKGSGEVPSYRKHHHRTDYSPVDNGIDNERMSPIKPTARFISNSNSKSRSLSSSSSTFSSKSHSHRSRNHRSRSGSRSRSSSRSRSGSRSRSSSRSRPGSRSRSSSRVSLSVSTSSGPSSNSLKKATSPPQKEVDTSFENPKLETMDTNTNHIKKCEKDTTHLEIHDLEEDGETAMVDRESENRKKSMVITSEEMLMVIKHYGLKQDEGVDDDNESFFGCGRLWPWEVIYYRRLKKGPISNENYARRVLQNREFGIVDKYVRSSSGWGEVA